MISFASRCSRALALPTALLLTGCCCLKTGETDAPKKLRDLAFARHGERVLKLDLYLPSTPPPKSGYPLILCFHGGGWAIKDKRFDVFLRPLTRHGYAIASAQYRLSGEAAFPAQIEDARAALGWLVANARRYDIDPDRIGTFGPSAGGHLALLLGLSEVPRRTVQAVCALYPPTDLPALVPEKNRQKRSNPIARLLGGAVGERFTLAVQASPISHVSRTSPAVLLIHGERDRTVPPKQSRMLHDALRRAGAPSELIILGGRGHAFGLSEPMLLRVRDFFDRNLRIERSEGEPSSQR